MEAAQKLSKSRLLKLRRQGKVGIETKNQLEELKSQLDFVERQFVALEKKKSELEKVNSNVEQVPIL